MSGAGSESGMDKDEAMLPAILPGVDSVRHDVY